MHITQKTLSFLHSTKVEQITKTMVIFKTRSIFLCCIPCNPIPSQTSVHRHANTRNVTTCHCSIQVSNATSIFPLHINFQGESLNSKMDATQGWVVLGLCLDHEMTKLNYSQRLRNYTPEETNFLFSTPGVDCKTIKHHKIFVLHMQFTSHSG